MPQLPKYIVLVDAHYEIEVEAETAEEAEAEAARMVRASTSDSILLGPGSWDYNAVPEDAWGV